MRGAPGSRLAESPESSPERSDRAVRGQVLGEPLVFCWMRRRCLCLLLLGASAWLGAQACVVEIRDLRPVDTSSGGAASSSSSSSALGAGGAGGGAGGTSPCPDEMVHVTDPVVVDANFCIDRTEVTQKQFAAFLVAVDNDVANTTQPDACATNETLQQTGTFCPDSKPNDTAAVNCVDWCDAYAYCAHYDKRLCGTLFDGSSLDYDAPGETDEWEFACSAGGEQKWPYGNSVEVCNCYFAVEWGNLDGSGGGGGSGAGEGQGLGAADQRDRCLGG